MADQKSRSAFIPLLVVGGTVLLIVLVLVLVALPWLQSKRMASNARAATVALRRIAMAEEEFRSNDRNGNGVRDYWTADVAGLWQQARLIDREIAEADAKPMDPLVPEPVQFQGYYFVALTNDRSEDPPHVYRQSANDSGAKVYNTRRFGFCAYPAEYGRTGTLTFFINEGLRMIKTDTGGRPMSNWPSDQELSDMFRSLRD